MASPLLHPAVAVVAVVVDWALLVLVATVVLALTD